MHEEIVEKFIENFKNSHPDENIEVEGILGFGSNFNRKKIDKNSDLDLFIIIKNIGRRFRGIDVVDGVKIDYFINSFEQLKKLWNNFERGNNSQKTILYMLKDGKILKDKNNQLDSLQKEVNSFFKNNIKNFKFSNDDLVIQKYFIEDYFEDMKEDLKNKNIASWQYNSDLLLVLLIEFFCKINQISLAKPKYMMEEIFKKDKNFIIYYSLVSESLNMKEKQKNISVLVKYCLDIVGGSLPEKWELEQIIK